MNKITAALFDLDGTLIDSEKWVKGSFEHVFQLFGIHPDRRNHGTKALSGLTLRETYASVADPDKILAMTRAHVEFQANNLHLVTVFGDVIESLRELRSLGIRTGVITNRSVNARSIMEHCGMGGLIDLTVSVEDVTHPKPHPEGILKALKHFGAAPDQAIMVGDMAPDVIAGRAAGVVTVGVDTSNQFEALMDSEPNHLVHTMKDLIPLFW